MQQALTFSESNGLRFVEDHTIPKPKKGEALLKILRAGICSTVNPLPHSIHFIKFYY